MELNGQGALVAGGASGLGEATARELAARGASVTIADLNEERGEALADELGGRFVEADVTDEAAVSARGAGGRRAAPRGVLRRHRLGRAHREARTGPRRCCRSRP